MENTIAVEYNSEQLEAIDAARSNFGIKDLPQLLRWLGAIILFASAASFLIQGWGGWSSIYRYGYFLLFTLSLSAFGFGLGIKMRDAKGARTLLAIGAAFLPAHATQLGAMIYANFAGKADFGNHLSYLAFDPVPVTSMIIIMVIAAVVLVPVVYSGISAMARDKAGPLTAVYLASNFLLLLPFRNGSWVAVGCLLALVALLYLDRVIFQGETAMETWEGSAMRILPTVPVAVAVGRNLLLYPTTATMQAISLLAIAGLIVAAGKMVSKKETGQLIQFLAILPTIGAGTLLASDISKAFLTQQYQGLVSIYTIAAGLIALGIYSVGTGRNYFRFAAAIALCVGFGEMMRFESFFEGTNIAIIASLICIVNSLITTIAGFELKDKAIFRFGLIALIGTLVYQLNFAYIFSWVSPWMALAGLGLAIVFASSLLETKGDFFKESYGNLKQRFVAK